jgi:Immunoglobulin I-set domain.
VKPWINRDKLQKVIVRAGHAVKFDVDIKGEPPPTVVWSKNGTPLENDLSTKIENEDYNTKIAITDTTRKNTGEYKIRAENINGFDEATVEVVILGEYKTGLVNDCEIVVGGGGKEKEIERSNFYRVLPSSETWNVFFFMCLLHVGGWQSSMSGELYYCRSGI